MSFVLLVLFQRHLSKTTSKLQISMISYQKPKQWWQPLWRSAINFPSWARIIADLLARQLVSCFSPPPGTQPQKIQPFRGLLKALSPFLQSQSWVEPESAVRRKIRENFMNLLLLESNYYTSKTATLAPRGVLCLPEGNGKVEQYSRRHGDAYFRTHIAMLERQRGFPLCTHSILK